MALSNAITRAEASAIETVCSELAALLAKVETILEHNSDLSIDWAGDPKPDAISEDADGNIDGLRFSRTDVANAVGSLDQVRKLLTNQATSQGDHLGNINKLSRPMPLR